MYCADCEKLNHYFFDNTYIWLFFPTGESTKKAISMFTAQRLNFEKYDSHCISLVVERPKIKHFLLSLYGEFEAPELNNIKITTSQQSSLTLEDTGRIITAETLINRYNSMWIVESIEANRYESHFQPILKLEPDGQVTDYANEALFRMKDEFDNIVPPSHVFSLAEHSDLLFTLDLIARRSAVSHFAKADLSGKLFINFDPSSIYDPSYCLRATVSAIHNLGIKPENVVFEITETHKLKNDSILKGILGFYRNSGFKVALDDIGSGWSGLNMLHKVRPDYVKIDMDLIRDIDKDLYKQTIVNHLIKIARKTGTSVIAEGIETEAEFNVIKELQADFVQGFKFAKPRKAGFISSKEKQIEIDRILEGIK